MNVQKYTDLDAFLKRGDVLAKNFWLTTPKALREIDPTVAIRKFREGKAESYRNEILRRYKLRSKINHKKTTRPI